VWDAQIGEEFYCARETRNIRDPYAVTVKKADLTVGHIPKVSALCSLFLLSAGLGRPAQYWRALMGVGNFC